MTLPEHSNSPFGSAPRAHRPFWIVDPATDLPLKAEGYECPGNYWWFPQVSYSLPASRCHAALADAIREATADLERRRDRIEATLIKLREGY